MNEPIIRELFFNFSRINEISMVKKALSEASSEV